VALKLIVNVVALQMDAVKTYVVDWCFVESRVRPKTSVMEGCWSEVREAEVQLSLLRTLITLHGSEVEVHQPSLTRQQVALCGSTAIASTYM
jgi:hypothetical protein